MKKILIASFLVTLAATSSFGAASAAVVWTNAGKAVVAGKTAAATELKPIGKTSTGVALAYITATTGYAILTQHKLGVKAFGTSADSTAIFSKTVVKDATTANPATADSADFVAASGAWTSM